MIRAQSIVLVICASLIAATQATYYTAYVKYPNVNVRVERVDDANTRLVTLTSIDQSAGQAILGSAPINLNKFWVSYANVADPKTTPSRVYVAYKDGETTGVKGYRIVTKNNGLTNVPVLSFTSDVSVKDVHFELVSNNSLTVSYKISSRRIPSVAQVAFSGGSIPDVDCQVTGFEFPGNYVDYGKFDAREE